MAQSVRKKTNSKAKAGTLKKSSRRIISKGRKRSEIKPSTRVKSGRDKTPATKSGLRAKSLRHREVVIEEFKAVVNIPRDQLERWLSTPESKKLRFLDEPKMTRNGSSGLAVLKILSKRRDKITDEDIDQMRSVTEFIENKLLKRPKGDIVASNWRYSLMNWGHDPAKRTKRLDK